MNAAVRPPRRVLLVSLDNLGDLAFACALVPALRAARPDVEVGVTVTTMDEAMRRRFEPFSSPSARRIEALRRLNAAGIRTWAFIGPILPGATDATAEALLRAVHGAGTTHVMIDRLRYRPGVWDRVEDAARALSLLPLYAASRDDPRFFEPLEAHLLAVGRDLGLRIELAFPAGW